MSQVETYNFIQFEPEWVYQPYYGWKVILEKYYLRVLLKKVGPINRYLILSQLDKNQLLEELSNLSIFTPLSMVTIKDFKNQENSDELKINDIRIAKASESERMMNKHTFVIDLSLEPDAHWTNLNSHTKRLCKKAITAGMTIESSSSPSDGLVSLFFSRYVKMAKDRSLVIPNKKIINKMFRDGRLQLIYTQIENEICTMILVYTAGLKSIFLYGVSGNGTNDGSSQFLHWKTIELLKQSGQRWYDLGGVPEVCDTNGIYRFKKGFGGNSVNLGPEFHHCPATLLFAMNLQKKLSSML